MHSGIEIGLASYAAIESGSLGRRYAEPASRYRGEYQRDRDRIVHSTAFRRLVYKTQVFVNHEGDLYRTRLTHSLEVAQIGRTVARALRLNESLTEAICLAHDLGHTPFGHAGQDSLNSCMRDYGGFEHNLQSLRVVDKLEAKYADFPGLNLTFETREGILKHCSARNARALGDIGKRFLERRQPGLEAQIADLADAIAYNNHDVDDGLRAKLLTLEQLREQSIVAREFEAVHARYPQLEDRRLIYEIIRRMINRIVTDLIENARSAIEEAGPETIEDVRARPAPLVALTDVVAAEHLALKQFLGENLYRHPTVKKMTDNARDMVQSLFGRYMTDPQEMPEEFSSRAARGDESAKARVVADYIAGMTDRFAIAEFERLT
ncbi:MAG: deoxyguanosinetriphosphate triphosphohydrolase [Gammaproteobacteria bacterium]|nr:deoxyguanosinetriphosphate triphosphohydrolase [Gammaproteobacteria bacterium]MDH5213189.1 deoxyguanosinetriphosphate triphosphohydrolase [Gammaproteobacteria bacterium]